MSTENNTDNVDNVDQKTGDETNIDFSDPKVQAAINNLVQQRVSQETEGLIRKRDELLGELKPAKEKLRSITEKYGEDLSRFDQLLEEEKKRKEADMTLEERLTSQYDAEFKRQAEQFSKKEKSLSDELKKKSSALEHYLIDSQLESEINKSDGYSHMLKPALRDKLRVVEDGDSYTVRVYEGDVPRLNMDGSQMTISDLVASFKNDELWLPAFKSSGATGGGATGNNTGAGGSQLATNRSNMSVEDKMDYIRKHSMAKYLELPE